jgi:hypothetical protein
MTALTHAITPYLLGLIVAAFVVFVLWCPIFKPWFGFWRPPGSRGKWGE